MSKKDDINELYNKSTFVSNINNIMFCLNVILSLVLLFDVKNAKDIITILQILLSLIFVILMIINECWLWYDAERARRKGNIQNAFNINLQQLQTKGYYNNNISPSLLKYAVNTFESNFFSKELASKMLIPKITGCIISVIIFIFSVRYVENNELLSIISQAIFSSYFLFDTAVLIAYTIRLKYWYDEAYNQLITTGIKDKQQLKWLLYYIVEYECVKAHFKVKIDKKIFKKYNLILSDEWEVIRKNISYFEDSSTIVL